MKAFLIFLLIIPASVFSQSTLPLREGKVVIEEVMVVDNTLTAKMLYNNCLMWFSKSFKSANDVIQFKSDETFTIVGKANFMMKNPIYNKEPEGYVSYTITIVCKDGKYKYTITDFVWDDLRGDRMPIEDIATKEKKIYETARQRFKLNTLQLETSLMDEMSKKPADF